MSHSELVAETVRNLESILDKLRKDTGAGRTTVRLDHHGLGFDVDIPAAESLAEGVHSIKPHTTLDQWNAAAVKWLVRNMRTFVMNDCLNPWDPEVAPEREVIDTYGIRSEMVAPVIKSSNLVGWVSVHYTKGPRTWTEDDIKTIESACDRVREVLESVDAASSEDPK